MKKLPLIAAFGFGILTILAIINYPNYDPFQNYLSDLGIGEKSAVFFNSALYLCGMFSAFHGYGLLRRKTDIKEKIASVLLIIGSIFLIQVGIFTEKEEMLHTIVSGVFFILYGLSFLLFGLAAREKKRSLEFGVSILGAFLIFTFIFLRTPIAEHVAVLGIGVWHFHQGMVDGMGSD